MIVRGITSTVLVKTMRHECAIKSPSWKEGCFLCEQEVEGALCLADDSFVLRRRSGEDHPSGGTSIVLAPEGRRASALYGRSR
jgi:hypothetical protein